MVRNDWLFQVQTTFVNRRTATAANKPLEERPEICESREAEQRREGNGAEPVSLGGFAHVQTKKARAGSGCSENTTSRDEKAGW